jgi:HAD superfamily hydrolase (TIGR01509 family)
MIKALIWDIGGVLVENPKYKKFWKRLVGSEQLRINFGMRKIDTKEFIRNGSKLMGMSQKEFLQEYKKYYWIGKRNLLVIQIFKKNKLKNYIFSDTNPIHLVYLKKIGKDLFDHSEKAFVDKRKKYSKSYKELLREINLKPKEVIFIDDKEKYVEMARNLGINSILYKNPKQLERDLKNFV